MILYFSGTGNSRFIANTINTKLNDQIFCINDAIKNKKFEELNSKKPFIFVLPTYAWRIPRIVKEFILNTSFTGTKKVYIVMTCGSSAGGFEKPFRNLMLKKQLNLLGAFEIKMPENYIALFKVPEEEKKQKIIDDGQQKALDIAELILKEEYIEAKHVGFKDKFLTSIINPIFYKVIVKSDDFYVKDSCINCGKCMKVCPTNNIYFENNKPKWKHKCTHCMACISICPQRAIEYEGKSEKKERHYLE